MEEGEKGKKGKKRSLAKFFLFIGLIVFVAIASALATRFVIKKRIVSQIIQWVEGKKEKEEEFQHPTLVVLKQIEKAREEVRNAWLGYELCEEKKVKWISPKAGEKKKIKKIITEKSLCKTNVLVAYITDDKDEKIKVLEIEERAPTNGFSVIGRPINLAARSYVRKPAGATILATKRMVALPGGKIREVVYTPYSENLNVYAVRLQGLSYLKILAVTAAGDLENLGVFSRAFPGELLPSVIPQRLAVVTPLVEQMDPYRFLKEEEDPRALVRETLTVLGANQEEGYRYIFSRAGARGQFQVIENTYLRLVERYPQAQLKRNFFEGTTDPRNATKAAFCLFDSDLSVLRAKHRRMLAGDIPTMGKFLAAAYNCGAGCVANAINKHGKRWEEHLPRETKIYVQKFSAVWSILYDNGKKGGEED